MKDSHLNIVIPRLTIASPAATPAVIPHTLITNVDQGIVHDQGKQLNDARITECR